MTPQEYTQLKAFARVDGLWMGLLWVSSFVCYLLGLSSPGLGLVAMILAIVTPFLAFRRLKRYRDEVADGVLSFMRGWGYVVLLFMYGSLILAAVQFVYFAFIDKGFFANAFANMMADTQTNAAIADMGLTDMVKQGIEGLRSMRPIDLVLNILTSNLFLGVLMAVPIAAVAKRKRLEKVN
ncbi:MAG: DUF4199 domain-containing protein [Prevotella sp.]|nr:DUF4199 domain-containing protein [Prevotella sp.]